MNAPSSSSSFEDPFSYTPLTQKKRPAAKDSHLKTRTKTTGWAPPKKKRKASPRKTPAAAPSSPVPSASASGGVPVTSLWCCFCQMPFSLLPSFTSPLVHESLCLSAETAKRARPACPLAERCDVTIPNHYVKYNHLALARFRAEQGAGDVQYDRGHDTVVAGPNIPGRSPTVEESKPRKPDERDGEDGDDAGEMDGDDDLFEDLIERHMSSSLAADETAAAAAEVEEDSEETRLSPIITDDVAPLSKTATHAATDATAAASPVHIRATGTKDTLQFDVRVDPSVDLRHLQLEMNRRGDVVQSPVRVSARVRDRPEVVSIADAKEKFGAIFRRGREMREKERAAEAAKQVEQPRTRFNGNEKGPSSSDRRPCPFYKLIPGTQFCVDAFNYGRVNNVNRYFLSHFHYDHYIGLTRHFDAGTIVCSEITSRLVQLKIRVPTKRLRPLPMNEPVLIDGVEVTLLDANHCPGAVMFLFKFTSGKSVLHCGDFRASPQMESIPQLWNHAVDTVYLDTTYCKPEHDFPAQADVIQRCVELVLDHVAQQPRTLVLVGSYTIGKERVFSAVADALDCKVWAGPEKTKVLRQLRDGSIDARLVATQHLARVHVVEMKRVQRGAREDLRQYLALFGDKYNHLLTVVPTGWTHNTGQNSAASLRSMQIKKLGNGGSNNLSRLDVPYSEHSSFSELKRFITFLRLSSADKVIPTVNVGSPASRKQMKDLFKEWIEGNDGKRREQIDAYLKKS